MKLLLSMITQWYIFLKKSKLTQVFLITLFGLLIRLYRLDNLPSEMWGDVIEHYKLVQSIYQGNFFYNYQFGGDGPLFSYLASLISLPFGLSFNTLKITSVLISTALIPVQYSLSYYLFKKNNKLALISSLIVSFSFWSLMFSHQAKPYILVPLIAALSLAAILAKKRLLAGIFLGLGMYSQAAFWGIFILAFSHWKTFVSAVLVSSLFWLSVYQGTTPLSSNSYIGEKFAPTSISQKITGIGHNIFVTYRSLFYHGDTTFRHNIPSRPHLDVISQAFLIFGLLIYFKQKKINYYLLTSLLIFPLSSFLDVSHLESFANFGRTIGLIVPTTIFVSLGIYFLLKRFNQKTSYLLSFLILLLISILNLYPFYFSYPKTLPLANFAFSQNLNNLIKNNYPQSPIVLVDCCWLNSGIPEPNSLKFSLPYNSKYFHLEYEQAEHLDFQLENLLNSEPKSVLIINPRAETLVQELIKFYPTITILPYTYANESLALIAFLKT